MPPKPLPLSERFRAMWMPEPNSGCWLWMGYVNPRGYGQIGLGAPSRALGLAPRVSWELHIGPVPRGFGVSQSCGVHGCVNPRHLMLSISFSRMQKCSRLGRLNRFIKPRGTAHVRSKLTDEKVRVILKSRQSVRALAARLNVCSSTVHNVRHRKIWRHVTAE